MFAVPLHLGFLAGRAQVAKILTKMVPSLPSLPDPALGCFGGKGAGSKDSDHKGHLSPVPSGSCTRIYLAENGYVTTILTKNDHLSPLPPG